MICRLHTFVRSSVLTLLAIALLSVPFAHRVGAAPVTNDMALFLSSGGLYADICGETGEHLSGGCESCRIVSAMMLAEPTVTELAQCLPYVAPKLIHLHDLTVQQSPERTPPARAPPSA
jgi:hypothetical protein